MSSNEEKLTSAEERDAEQDAGEQAAATDVDPAELHALLTDARSKADEHWDQCVRLQAEIDNVRKRNERDLANARKFALEKFAAELLPVKDSLEMGLTAAEENADVTRLREGGELTLKMLSSALDKFKIKEVSALNEQFNPEYHEAMSMQERSDVEPNTVLVVVQKGYLLNDRLLRPAMVIVSRAAQQPAGGQLDEQA